AERSRRRASCPWAAGLPSRRVVAPASCGVAELRSCGVAESPSRREVRQRPSTDSRSRRRQEAATQLGRQVFRRSPRERERLSGDRGAVARPQATTLRPAFFASGLGPEAGALSAGGAGCFAGAFPGAFFTAG